MAIARINATDSQPVALCGRDATLRFKDAWPGNETLDVKHRDHANADGKMTDEQKREFVKKFEADLITPAEALLWKRGASNAG